MPKLYFRHGTMNSSKTTNLLMVYHNYMIQNRRVLLIKPKLDVRFGTNAVTSRLGISISADILVDENTNLSNIDISNVECILVDECQFLSDKHIDQLRLLTNRVPVICYGLRSDYKTLLFSGSKRLFEIADTIEEIKTVCINCDKKAIINAKFSSKDGIKEIIKSGSDAPDLGAEEKYQPMCFECWYIL